MPTLSARLARQILQFIEDNGIKPGEHLGETRLGAFLAVSRTPVRAALKVLEAQGIVESRPNRGFFLLTRSHNRKSPAPATETDAPYFRIGEDRLAGVLPERITESELSRRYGLTLTQTSRLLERMTQEGWAERLPGKGWRFLPVLNTEDAYLQMFQFRVVIEPAALLLPGYALTSEMIERLRRQQESLRTAVPGQYSRAEYFQLGAFFHEAIVGGARNDLMTESIRRANQLRRLMDYRYRSNIDPARIAAECTEHLELLALIENGELARASATLREHLESAMRRKTGLMAP